MNAAAPPPSRRGKNFGVSRFAAAAEGQKRRRAAADLNIFGFGLVLDCIRSVFLSNFCRKKLQKYKMLDFSKMTSFLRKNRLFFKRILPTLNSTFFKFSKSNLVVPKIYQKKLPNKILQDGGYFQNGVCTFFLYENMSCDRYFRSMVLIFGLTHYFLTFNHTKINFGFLDHPNMGLPYKILVG
jgi:hypothetical protein